MQASQVKFCGLLFDRKQGTISLNDQVFHLEHQQAKILNLLIENKDTVVSREQIANQVWQGIIVEDNTISKAITRLRKVLNDSAKSPQIIKTIPKQGYRFIAEIKDVSATTESSEVMGTAAKAIPWFKWDVLLLALVALFALLTLLQESELPTEPVIAASIPKPISFREGIELNAHLHADKNKLLFVGDETNGYSIFTKNIGDANARLLTPVSSRRVYPKWLQTADDSFVFSDLDADQQCQIFKVKTIRSAQREVLATCLSDLPVEVFVHAQSNSIFWSDNAGSWQQDLSNGKRKFLPYNSQDSQFQMPSPNGQLWASLKSIDGQSILSIYDTDKQNLILERQLPYAISHFKWSKASDALYHLGEHPANKLYQLSLSGEHKLLAATSLGAMTRISDVQSADSIEFVISSVDLDIHQLKNGRETKRINSPFADYNPALSSQSNQLAFASKRTGSAQIWLQDENSSLTQISQFERASYIYQVAWSPNESMLLVKRNESIHIINPATREERVLSVDAKDKIAWQWLSDQKVAYIDLVSKSLFSYEINEQHSALLLANVGFAQYADGQWFVADTAGESLHQYDANFANKKLITAQLNHRHWLISAGQLYVVNKLNAKPINLVELGNNERTVISGPFNPLSVRTTKDGTLIFHRMNSNEANIYQLHLD